MKKSKNKRQKSGKIYSSKKRAWSAAERQAGHQVVAKHPSGRGYIIRKKPYKRPKRIRKGIYPTRNAARKAAEARGGKDRVKKLKNGQWKVQSVTKRKKKK